MDINKLTKEIEATFPLVEMPSRIELSIHKENCPECDDLVDDIDQYRDKEITGDAIRLIHQELSLLSAKAWQWILPHYLRFCLTSEAEYNRMETEFLIYNLSPSDRYHEDTLQRLSLLNKDQLNCLIHFLEWCEEQQYWKSCCADDIWRAKSFLSKATQRGQVLTSDN
jgi:hypothetical protein